LTDGTDSLAALTGRQLPEGTYRIDPVVATMLSSAVLATPTDTPHPIFAFVAAQNGIGITVGDLLAMFGTKPEDGPLLGECELVMHQPFQAGVTYQVTGRIDNVTRKHGRALGAFDLVTFTLDVRDCAGEPVSTCSETFVLPRREDAP
jgi:hypothetical protein